MAQVCKKNVGKRRLQNSGSRPATFSWIPSFVTGGPACCRALPNRLGPMLAKPIGSSSCATMPHESTPGHRSCRRGSWMSGIAARNSGRSVLSSRYRVPASWLRSESGGRRGDGGTICGTYLSCWEMTPPLAKSGAVCQRSIKARRGCPLNMATVPRQSCRSFRS
jgi:hypothetical protein